MGCERGVLKGVRPLHGVTGASRRREGAWPPSGSVEATTARLRMPTLSAITSRAVRYRVEPRRHPPAVKEGGSRTGVLKGVFPLHRVTGAKRRREGAWPPSGSAKAAAARLRMPTLSATISRAVRYRVEPEPHPIDRKKGGMRTGVLKGVRPLHGVTGASRRREGAWPPSGSVEATTARLRMPTLSATMSKAMLYRMEPELQPNAENVFDLIKGN